MSNDRNLVVFKLYSTRMRALGVNEKYVLKDLLLLVYDQIGDIYGFHNNS